jgi:hypothetical protein
MSPIFTGNRQCGKLPRCLIRHPPLSRSFTSSVPMSRLNSQPPVRVLKRRLPDRSGYSQGSTKRTPPPLRHGCASDFRSIGPCCWPRVRPSRRSVRGYGRVPHPRAADSPSSAPPLPCALSRALTAHLRAICNELHELPSGGAGGSNRFITIKYQCSCFVPGDWPDTRTGIVNLTVHGRVRPGGWDHGAVTLRFGRTSPRSRF